MARLLMGLLLTAALPFAAPPPAQLYLNPASGPPTQQFTATFSFSTSFSSGCRGYTVDFTWDTFSLGSVVASGRGGVCSAQIATRPPPVDSTPGSHRVTASTRPAGFAAQATFVILAARPSPSPTPKPTASPSPKPSPTPSPTASPTEAPSPSPTPGGPASGAPCTAASVPSQPGVLQIDGIAGSITVLDAGPPQMLPPLLGSQRLIAMQVTKAEDAISPVLQDALTAGTVYPCAFLSLAPAAEYRYARYAFEDASVIGLQSSLSGTLQVEETVTLMYRQVQWTWQGEDRDGRIVTRSGSGTYGSTAEAPVANKSGGPPGWLWVLLGAAAAGGVAVGTARLRGLWPFL